jgi:signal transduction histidine kinase/ligand-binding sensor domain-containing protein/CheY-like chemotaxis protein/AraC-like DNA-binding protein
LGQNRINDDVTALLFDNHNNIWIGTDNGLSKFNLEKGECLTFYHDESDPASIQSSRIRSLALGNSGKVWIGTRDAGLNVYHPQSQTFQKLDMGHSQVKSPSHIKSILMDGDDKMWVGTLYDGLYRIVLSDMEVKSVINYRSDGTLPLLGINDIYCLLKGPNNEILIGSRDGLYVIDKGSGLPVIASPNILLQGGLSNSFRAMFRDRDNHLWFGTWDGLMVCRSLDEFKKGNFQWIKHKRDIPNSISHDQVLDIYQDRSGIVWIGTESGLNKYDPFKNQFKPIEGEGIGLLKEQTATAFCPFKDGMLILTWSDGVFFNKDGQISRFCEALYRDQEVQKEKLYSILADAENNVWLGSYNGLLIKTGEKGRSITKYRLMGENAPIYSIIEQDKDYLLIGSGTFQGGLHRFDKRSGKATRVEGLEGNIEINDIHIDRSRNLWIATQRGILKRGPNERSFVYFLPESSDSFVTPNIFTDIEESKDGSIFISGRNGLYRYHAGKKEFENIGFKNVKALWATDLQFDSGQALWLNLNFNQIAKWDTKSESLMLFDVNNGVRSTPFNRRGFYIDNNDVLFFSGFDQIYQFGTKNYLSNTYSPKPVFTKLMVNNSEVGVGAVFNKQVILKKHISSTSDIVLNHRNKDFALSFASASYANPRSNQYRYKLHGHDKEWQTGNNRLVQYSDIRPGKYLFEVFSSNNAEFWSQEPATLNIRVKPYPFFSLWAFLAYFVVLSVGSWQARKVVLARIRLKRELLIEKVKREKEENFNKERLQFYTNISHELRTPLTLIIGPVKQLLSQESNSQSFSKLYQLIHDNSQRLLSLVNQLLDFRKSLFEGMKLKVTYADLIELVDANLQAFEYMAKEKSINVGFQKPETSLHGWFDLEKVDIILFNILSNAFKFTPEGGNVRVEVIDTGSSADGHSGHVELVVGNSGKGIPKHLHDKVFERFYKLEDSPGYTHQNRGSGIGLSFVKKLVQLHHGSISLESSPGKMTCFRVVLPLGKEAYSAEEVFDFKRDADRRTREMFSAPIGHTLAMDQIAGKNGGYKLLVVEDNRELREFLFDYLHGDFEVHTANNGLAGLEICRMEMPDLVISDIMMDHLNGIELCKQMKSTPEISHIPVILMTALASVENKMTGYKMGADDYITKPFEPDLLRIRIENILNNTLKNRQRFSKNIDISAKELTISKIDEDFMGKVTRVLDEKMQDEYIDIDGLSKELGVSTSHLYRKIKGITGLSPIDFVNTYRLKRAAHLIVTTDMNISEIAYKVGFNNPNYFSRIFKKHFEVSPSQFKG